ncbi:hypothetical protein LCGC14_2953840, partial [marine sediment metagenome]
FAGDPLAGQVDPAPKEPAGEKEIQIAAVMSAAELAAGRDKLLAFARRKILVDDYRMDPAWMLAVMNKYGPMDWRHVNAHAIYWATLGLHRATGAELAELRPGVAQATASQIRTEDVNLQEITRLNTERTILGALKSLARTGQLVIQRRPDEHRRPGTYATLLNWAPDWRFIDSTHQEYVASGTALTNDPEQLGSEANTLRDGHANYLEDVVLQLFFARREDLAKHYLKVIRTRLKPPTDLHKTDTPLSVFVREKVASLGSTPKDLARTYWTGGLRAAYLALAHGDGKAFGQYRRFAWRSYLVYVADVAHAERLRPPPFPRIEANFLVNLLLRFHDLEGGRILIDGQDITGVTQKSLRTQIAMVTQDTSLLHRSV